MITKMRMGMRSIRLCTAPICSVFYGVQQCHEQRATTCNGPWHINTPTCEDCIRVVCAFF